MEVFVFVVFCLAYVLPAIIASSKAHQILVLYGFLLCFWAGQGLRGL